MAIQPNNRLTVFVKKDAGPDSQLSTFVEASAGVVVERPMYFNSVPHQRWGEAVTAVIQLKPGMDLEDEEVKSFCKERLADYKAPKYVIYVDELPRLITGKVHYRELKNLVSEKYEGEGIA